MCDATDAEKSSKAGTINFFLSAIRAALNQMPTISILPLRLHLRKDQQTDQTDICNNQ